MKEPEKHQVIRKIPERKPNVTGRDPKFSDVLINVVIACTIILSVAFTILFWLVVTGV